MSNHLALWTSTKTCGRFSKKNTKPSILPGGCKQRDYFQFALQGLSASIMKRSECSYSKGPEIRLLPRSRTNFLLYFASLIAYSLARVHLQPSVASLQCIAPPPDQKILPLNLVGLTNPLALSPYSADQEDSDDHIPALKQEDFETLSGASKRKERWSVIIVALGHVGKSWWLVPDELFSKSWLKGWDQVLHTFFAL